MSLIPQNHLIAFPVLILFSSSSGLSMVREAFTQLAPDSSAG